MPLSVEERNNDKSVLMIRMEGGIEHGIIQKTARLCIEQSDFSNCSVPNRCPRHSGMHILVATIFIWTIADKLLCVLERVD